MKYNIIRNIKESIYLLMIFTICTSFCYLLDLFKINDLNFLIIYILGVVIVSVSTSQIVYAIIMAIASVFGYNFFFTIPKYTFHFNDRNYLITFLLMAIIGLLVGAITFVLKRKMKQVNKLALEKEKLKNENEKEQYKASLLRSISHDLRTPLTTIKNAAELLRTNEFTKEESLEIIDSIYNKSFWTIRLVENLLSLTRIENKSLKVKKKPEALEEIIPEAVRIVSGILEERKITYDMPKDLFLVPMDSTLIIQTISNILGNAIKFTEHDGNIKINVFNSGKNAIFRFYNDGKHINEEDLPYIFNTYYKGGDSIIDNGIGLGLSICKMIINAHDGEIYARNLKKGVVFEFTLPLGE